MKVKNLQKIKSNGFVKLSVDVESVQTESELWFSVPEKFESCLCDSQYDAFVVGLLYPAFLNAEELEIEGPVSKQLCFNLNNYVLPLFTAFSGSNVRTKVLASELSEKAYGGMGVGVGLSAGVDSFCTLFDRFEMCDDFSSKVNILTFFNVGSHGSESQQAALQTYQSRLAELKKLSAILRLPLIDVNSNLHLFHQRGHQLTHTLTSCAAALLLQRGVRRYYYSSGISYRDIPRFSNTYAGIDIGAFCDPALIPMLSTESLGFFLEGAQYRRPEKVQRIADYLPARQFLNVCTRKDGIWINCSQCEKCKRTMFALTVLGKSAQYDSIFDFERWGERGLAKYWVELYLDKNKLLSAAENYDFAVEKGFTPPKYTWHLVNFARVFMPRLKRYFRHYFCDKLKAAR